LLGILSIKIVVVVIEDNSQLLILHWLLRD
jgi:hypothetical protein